MPATLPITVQPGMTLPINLCTAVSGTAGNSMNVSFAVQSPDFCGVYILLSITIKVKIGTVTIIIHYTRLVQASGQIEIFNSLLPVDSIIQEITPTYEVVEVIPG